MQLRTNRLATLMVAAGIVGSLVTLFKFTQTSTADSALPTAQTRTADREHDLCQLAAKLADAADPTMRLSGESLRKANGCPSR